MANVQNGFPVLLDREISSEEHDAFGHRDLAMALQALLESPSHMPPYSIGVLGKWGSGKSSIKSIYLSKLTDDLSKDETGRKRSESVVPITFNAWRFGGENIKRALLRHVYLEIGGDPTILTDALFKKIQETVQTSRSWKAILQDFYERWLWSLVQLLVVMVFIAGFLAIVSKLFNLDNAFAEAAIIIALIWLGHDYVKHIFSSKRSFIPRYSNFIRIDEPRSSAEEFEDLLIYQLRRFKEENGRYCKRLVVFVDDLDRLSAEEMVSGLDAVRTFLEIPQNKLPRDLGIIFVISCDEDRVAEALAGRRNSSRSPDLPATVSDKSGARRYLDRIFQFRLEIPDVPKMDMRNFAKNKLTGELQNISSDLQKADVSIEMLVDRLVPVGIKSPRNAIQIINAFCQSWWLAKRREKEGAGTDRPGGLQEGAVAKHPISLAAICALRVNFPDFYNDLLQDPDLIRRFTDVFHRKQPLSEQPELVQAILRCYMKKDELGELAAEHRPLRQYVVSLQGVRWPSSMQPLLLLAQDPVTRRLGDNALPLYEAFVSGDHNELLRLIGRDKDDRPIAENYVRMLQSMSEDLVRETTVKKNNAAACLAAIVDRLPPEHARNLVSPIARQLADSDELRCRLGIEKIRNILTHATAEDKQDVAGRLINDLLRIEGDITFKKESMQTPSLDEAINMVHEAFNLAMWVRAVEGLHHQDDISLLMWLEHRRVSIKGSEFVFQFSSLEKWLDEHEKHLLRDLRDRYTTMVIDQLETSTVDESLAENMLRRCNSVFKQLWNEGEESREILWKQVMRMVAVQNKKAVEVAWEQVNSHTDGPDANALSLFISALAGRLLKDCEDEENWGVDWEHGGVIILNILANRWRELNEASQKDLTDLCIAWNNHEVCSPLACTIAEKLIEISSKYYGDLLTSWVTNIYKGSAFCAKWLAAHYNINLSDSHKVTLVQQLQATITKDVISEEEAATYSNIISNLPSTAFTDKAFKEHLTNLCVYIQTRYANQNEALTRLFPVLPNIVQRCPPSAAGNMLHQLFTSSKNTPPLYGWLHNLMATYWPKQDASLSPYNPQQLFDDAIQLVTSNPGTKAIDGCLKSATSMIITNVVPENNKSKIASAACILWQYEPKSAIQAIKSLETVPNNEEIANISAKINPNDTNDISNLRVIWSYCSERMSLDDLIKVALVLLSSNMIASESETDFATGLWIELCGDNQVEILEYLITNSALNDEQLHRTWQQILRFASNLSGTFMLKIIAKVLTLDAKPHTIRSVIDDRQAVNAFFKTKDDQYQLAKEILNSILLSTSQETRNRLCEWIKEINASAVLKELKSYTSLTEEHIELLKSQFPKSKYLQL